MAIVDEPEQDVISPNYEPANETAELNITMALIWGKLTMDELTGISQICGHIVPGGVGQLALMDVSKILKAMYYRYPNYDALLNTGQMAAHTHTVGSVVSQTPGAVGAAGYYNPSRQGYGNAGIPTTTPPPQNIGHGIYNSGIVNSQVGPLQQLARALGLSNSGKNGP